MSSKKKNRQKRSASARRSENRPCSCGSGHPYKECCGKRKQDNTGQRERSARSSGITLALILCLLAGGILLAVFRPWEGWGKEPGAWEYDEARDRHWDPEHGHWHDGAPPDFSGAAPAAPAGPAAPAAPRPWEYDEVNNRYWHPLHGHWHEGRPPDDPWAIPMAMPTSEPPPETTREPWEYDEINDQHWDPDHGHWHPGPPPPPENR